MQHLSPDDALKMLMEGNARFVAAKAEHPAQSAERRAEVAKGQAPFAVVLGCADSRLSPEILFDRGLGDLFVVRVAGNIADDAVIGSIEYAVEHLHAPLVMVLGHEKCGAVQAAIDTAAQMGDAPGHLGALTKPIQPAVAQAKTQGGDLLDTAIIANVGNVTAQLKMSEPVLAHMVHDEHIKVWVRATTSTPARSRSSPDADDPGASRVRAWRREQAPIGGLTRRLGLVGACNNLL